MYSRTFALLLVFFSFIFSNLSYAQEAIPGEYIVTYKSFNVSSKALAKTSLNHNLSLKTSWSMLRTYHFQARSLGDDDRIIEDLKKDPSVLSVEPNYILKKQSLFTRPSTNENIFIDEGLASVSLSQQNSAIRGGQTYSPIVAIIDSGLDTNHEIFRGNDRLWVNTAEIPENGRDDDGNGYIDDVNGWNFVDNSNNVYDDDDVGHGTHVAGVIASSSGVLGNDPSLDSVPSVRIMPLKFLNAAGEGTTSDAISAIYYAIRNGAKVLNNSWGGPNYSTALHQAVTFTFESNAVFVAASGNNGIDTDNFPLYPASFDVPNVISVGASQSGSRAYFSNYGASTVDIFAPGVGIYSSWPSDRYGRLSGTSMAAPYVSALAALMFIEAPQFSGYQVRRDMLASGQAFQSFSSISTSGMRVDFDSAISLTQENANESNYQPFYNPDYSSRSLASLDTGNSGMGCGMVKDLTKDKQTAKNTSIVLFLFLWPLVLSIFYREKTNRFVDQNLG